MPSSFSASVLSQESATPDLMQEEELEDIEDLHDTDI